MTAESPRLMLPEPARGVWLDTRSIVKDALARVQRGSAEYTIGGGTVLSARYGHRASSDIDIQTPPELGSVEELYSAEYADVRAAFEARGWRIIDNDAFNFFSVEKGAGNRRRRVELWTHEMPVRSGPATAEIEGEPEHAQSDIQILSGKTERFGRAVPRDVFDVCVLAERAPGSVEAAVNILEPRRLTEYATKWAHEDRTITETAEDVIREVPREFADKLARLGIQGAGALRAAAYSMLRLEIDGGRLVVTSKSLLRGQRTVETGGDGLDALLEERGLDRRMEAQGLRASEIAGFGKKMIERGMGTILYEEIAGRKTRWHFRDRGTTPDGTPPGKIGRVIEPPDHPDRQSPRGPVKPLPAGVRSGPGSGRGT